MFVECVKNNGTDYLRLVQGVRVTNKNGYRTSQKKVVLCIGPLAKFDDGQPDYIGRLKKSFRAGAPLIPALEPYCDANAAPAQTYHFTMQEGSPECVGHPRLFCHLLLEKMLEELGIRAFFSSYKSFKKLKYDVYGFAKLLIFGRLLNPDSKYATVSQNEDYYEPILADGFNPDNVYDALDFIYEHKDKITRRINTNLAKKAGRSPEIIYYDVTNFYYEIEEPDADITDEEGNFVAKGMRKLGVCKEERKLPIVQMGLFMDDNGIPISVETFPGNTLDHLTLRPALEKSIDNLGFSRFILISDRGMHNGMNTMHITDSGNGYIISKSLLKSTEAERKWTYDDNDYTVVNADFKYKARIVKRKAKDENGSIRHFEEQVIVYWSRKFQARSEHENKKFLDFLQELEDTPASFRVTAMQAKGLRKFLKDKCVNIKTGETINASDIRALIDFDKIAEYKKSMGYYQIVTSELTMTPTEVIDKYHNLTQIEDQFRVMKGTLSTRPLYVRTPEHIAAHLQICMIALVLLRIVQNRITKSGLIQLDESAYWNTGLNGQRIQKALNKWKVDKLQGDLYRFMDIDDPDLKLILDAFEIKLPQKLYRRAELKAIKTGTPIFM